METPKIPDYVTQAYLEKLSAELINGAGSGKPGDRCSIQEVRAWLDLDPSTDACPDCVCPVLHRLTIVAQDRRAEWRRQIAPLLPLLVGSRGSAELTRRRAFRCADWAVRTVAPFALEAAAKALEAAGIPRHPAILAEHAAKLRAWPEIAAAADAADAAARAAARADAAYAADAAAAAAAAADAAAAAADAADAADADAAAAAAAAYAAAAAAYAADAADAPSPIELLRELAAMTDATA